MIRVHSFDVFDTCLVRIWARPIDVLRAAAERATEGRPDAGRPELISELTRRRWSAEFVALDRVRADAVGIEAIFGIVADEVRALGIDPDAFLQAELELEREGLRPVAAALQRLTQARRSGSRVVFVSDMYLPDGLIRERLVHFGFLQDGDGLYVSGSLGVSKRTGRLFDHVLREEGIQAAELEHCGDDAHTDLAQAVRRGVAVAPLTIGRLDRFETAMLASSTGDRAAIGRIAGASRAARLSVSPESGWLRTAAEVTSGVVAPLFVAYVDWVLRAAREEGVERLYFVSRDAQILLRVADRLRRPGDPECRYLYGSRQAWFLPGIDALDRESLHWLLEPEYGLKTPRALLAKLDVDAHEVADVLARHGLVPDGSLRLDQLEPFWTAVADLEALIRSRVDSAGALARGYLKQEGLYSEAPWALVDIGWRLTAQSALRRVLARDGMGERVLGYYMGISQKRAPLRDSGPFRAFVLEDDELEAGYLPESWMLGNTGVIEQVFAMADHGSCVAYRQDGEHAVPVLRAQREDPDRDRYRRVLHASVDAFASEIASSRLLPREAAELRGLAMRGGRLALEHPTRAEAEALGRLRVGDDQNETRIRELAGPLRLADVLRRAQDKLGLPVTRDFGTDHLWGEASLKLTPPHVRRSFFALKRLEGRARQGRDILVRQELSRRVVAARHRRTKGRRG